MKYVAGLWGKIVDRKRDGKYVIFNSYIQNKKNDTNLTRYI